MIWIGLFAFALFVVGVLVCVKLDAPQYFEFVRRMVAGLVLALVLGTVLYAAEVNVLGCNDLEKYSLLWYYQLCFLYEHSS